MSYSATRLTCFALLAAIEQDMRTSIEERLAHHGTDDLIPEDRIAKANARRIKDGLSPTSDLPGILAYLDFAESYETLASRSADLPADLRTDIKQLGPSVARTVAIRNRVAHTRPMEIDDSSFLVDVARSLAGATSHWDELKSILKRLDSDPSFVLGLTISLPADPDQGPQHNLPVPDFDETGFFGRQNELRRIVKAIKGAYPVVSILGDGGIGKTSIALKAAYELLEDPKQPFDAFVWVTAKATILTPNEIRRINGAIETSLGLIGSAASELSGVKDVADPVSEVLAYMENFRILLLLDNLETVLDGRLREFLLELPMGSKVIVTSRIGLGIENPVQLAPLADDESTRLLRALARIRDVRQLNDLDQSTVESLARRMAGHPAYIRWFVAGVQSGRRPEDLLGNNELLLDFCMSNVYDYLKDDARAALRSMQVLAGAKNQAELAFLNDFTAAQTQAALLELLTTNFTAMSSQIAGDSLDTGYELSEFARQYLDKHHPVETDERDWLLQRAEELRDLGIEMAAANTASPFAPTSVHVRGPGDFHAAGLLRTAIATALTDPGAALEHCVEAQILAPGYYEAWRVEGFVRALSRDHGAAQAAYDRALELAPDSPAVLFHYGEFLLDAVGDPRRALELLQKAARNEPTSSEIAGQIAWAHFCLNDMAAAISASTGVATARTASSHHRKAACVLTLRAVQTAVAELTSLNQYDEAVEFVESGVELAEKVDARLIEGEASDRLTALRDAAQNLTEQSVDYAAKQAALFVVRIDAVLRTSPSSSLRRTGVIEKLVSEKGFGFVKAGRTSYFFHISDLRNRADWDSLAEGAQCVFEPGQTPKGVRAKKVRVVGP